MGSRPVVPLAKRFTLDSGRGAPRPSEPRWFSISRHIWVRSKLPWG